MSYPVSVNVERNPANRNRLTVGFRLILSVPHIILVGGVGIGVAYQDSTTLKIGGETGLLGLVAYALAIVSWFTILFGQVHSPGSGSSRRSICVGACGLWFT